MLLLCVALWANYQRLITGPYPFLLVYQQTTRQTVLWCAAILAMNLLNDNSLKALNFILTFRSIQFKFLVSFNTVKSLSLIHI